MNSVEVLVWLKKTNTAKRREDMIGYDIPNNKAFGIAMGDMKGFARTIGADHRLSQKLWRRRWYKARTIAVFVFGLEKLTGISHLFHLTIKVERAD